VPSGPNGMTPLLPCSAAGSVVRVLRSSVWLRDRLASYKKPTALLLVDELPRSAAGKVLKHELRSKYGELHR
jgi:fatty-acyl-CoA synthase